jgi:hypothetical protein
VKADDKKHKQKKIIRWKNDKNEVYKIFVIFFLIPSINVSRNSSIERRGRKTDKQALNLISG